MSAAERSDRSGVLVSWVSVGHRAAPFVSALGEPTSPLRGKVGKVYLCWRDAPSPEGDREREVLKETLQVLREELKPWCPELEPVPWETESSPTDHAALRPFAERVLCKVREQHPGAPIYIHISPGTPAMHAVWLVLGTTGLVEGPVQLLQGVEPKNRRKGQPPVEPVRFELDTWLRRYREARPREMRAEDDGQLWEPSRVRSPPLREALDRLVRWAPLRAPVLLVGERGTGKTTLANFLRAMSPFQRHEGTQWPVVVCGQFRANPQLARSELFGHKRGAYTGATSDRKGLLEEADGDTLFLDEIADIDSDTQRLLMAALEGRGFRRLGEERIRHSRFRLVSATNRSLQELVGSVLDPDFFDRIAVFTLRVPPLRECREDLPHLWRKVLARVAGQLELAPEGWQQWSEHSGLLRALEHHALPGNLRDLQRVAFHLLAALQAEARGEQALQEAQAALSEAHVEPSLLPSAEEMRRRLPLAEGLEGHLMTARRRWLEVALAEAGGNQSEAARLLGLKRETLRDWLGKGGTPMRSMARRKRDPL